MEMVTVADWLVFSPPYTMLLAVTSFNCSRHHCFLKSEPEVNYWHCGNWSSYRVVLLTVDVGEIVA